MEPYSQWDLSTPFRNIVLLQVVAIHYWFRQIVRAPKWCTIKKDIRKGCNSYKEGWIDSKKDCQGCPWFNERA